MRRISVGVVVAVVGGVLALAGASPAASAGGVVYVDVAAVGADDGSSWADAFTDLQDALAVVVAGDEIRVAEGTYRPHASDPSVSFELVDGVAVVGGYATGGVAGPDPDRHRSILSGDLNADDLPGGVNIADNSDWVVTSSENETVSLDGFEVTAGADGGIQLGFDDLGIGPDQLVDLRVVDNHGIGIRSLARSSITSSVIARNAAGILLQFGSMTLRDSEVSANAGSGVSLVDTSGPNVIDRSVVGDNSGAGITTFQGGATIVDSWIVRNGNRGIETDQTFLEIVSSVIAFNTSTGDGAGIGPNIDYAGLEIVDSLIVHNSTTADGGGIAVSTLDGSTITNSVIANNSAGGVAGGLLYGYGDLDVINSVITANRAGTGGGIVLQWPDIPGDADVDLTPTFDVANSIVWGNSPGPGIVDTGTTWTVVVSHSDVQGWTGGGVGNIDQDPRFVGPGNYRLQPTSPAREAGDNSVVPPDTFDVDDDGNTTEPTPDLDGRARIAGVVDMGAYERPLPSILPGGVVASSEGDSGSTIWELPVTLSAPQAVPVSIDWAIGDIPSNPKVAHPGSDVAAASGTLTFPPGATTASVPIEVLGDTADEPPLLYGEWGLVTFSNPSFATLDTSVFFGLGLFVVIDDDAIASNYTMLTGPGSPLEGASFPADGSIPTPYLQYGSGALITEGVGVDWYIDEVLFRNDDLNSPWNLGMLASLPIGVTFSGQGTAGSANTFLLGPGTHTVRAEASYPGGTKNFVATFTITG